MFKKRMRDANKIAVSQTAAYGFDPVISLITNSDATLAAHIALLFDRDTPGADANALACHGRLNEALQGASFYP